MRICFLCLWQDLLGFINGDQVGLFARDFPNVKVWIGRMKERDEVESVLREKSQAMAKMRSNKFGIGGLM